MKKVGIIGATGYAGVELVRILLGHKNVEIAALSSVSYEGQSIDKVYPSLKKICTKNLVSADEVLNSCDLIFGSLPHGLSEEFAVKCVASGKLFIDLGADFRLSESDYKEWYKGEYKNADVHEKSAYCIPELHRERLIGKSVVGNPGCYPTSISLGLAPIVKAELIDLCSIIIDSKSGVSGAGKSLSATSHYVECNENFNPYKIAAHRHTPEIEQNIGELAGKAVKVLFVPHLLPVNRGIESTIYVNLSAQISYDDIIKLYKDFYKNEQFVRVLDKGETSCLSGVRMSNYCDISLHLDVRTNRLIIVSCIDNLVKGAAGQAIQNMNILFGYDEGEGLQLVPACI